MRRVVWLAVLLLTGAGLVGPAAAAADKHSVAAVCSQKGGMTSSGEAYSPGKLTAAHRTLPFGTMVRVTNLRNGRTVVVRINDRGPFNKARIIDLTPAAASKLEFSGLAPVALDVVAPKSP
jgi:rare lipoprotein A